MERPGNGEAKEEKGDRKQGGQLIKNNATREGEREKAIREGEHEKATRNGEQEDETKSKKQREEKGARNKER